MTQETYLDLYDKHEPFIGRPVEILTDSSSSCERHYKKYLLKAIEGGKDTSSTPFAVVQDLENSQIQAIPLEAFDQAVRLVRLHDATTITLSNTHKRGRIVFENKFSQVEFLIIQISSHFGRAATEWAQIAGKIAILINEIPSQANPTPVPYRILLSSFIGNQIQPVFFLSRTFPMGRTNHDSQKERLDALEITLEELNPINEDFELTFVFEKKQ